MGNLKRKSMSCMKCLTAGVSKEMNLGISKNYMRLLAILCILLVGAGEAIACYVPGFLFAKALERMDSDLIR